MKTLLQIKNLSVDFVTEGTTTNAVKNISVDVHRGKIMAIVGESGSGKSVTALSLLQLLPQPPAVFAGGKILFSEDGEHAVDLLSISPDNIRKIRGAKISMIFQEPMTSLNPVMSCGRQVMEALLIHKNISADAAKKKTIEWFDKVKLPSPDRMFDRYPHQLSGGQKQRVMIAMAMCCEPSLLICDEPTTALDVTVQKAILDLIRELQQQQNMGVIFITHDLGVVAQIADEVAIMYKGEVVEIKNAGEIFSIPIDRSNSHKVTEVKNHLHPYTNALLACRPGLHPKGIPLPTVEDFTNEPFNKEPEVIKQQGFQFKKDEKPLLQVKDLVIRFPSKTNIFGKTTEYFTAVDGVSMEVHTGETLGLVGESGCGKTTLGRALLKLVEADSGQIIYHNKDITILSNREVKEFRKDVQLIFQDPYSSLNPRLTIGAAISEPIRVTGIENDRAKQKELVSGLLERVNMPSAMMKRYPHEFSGGQRQRIVIARALALNPGFLVCDESVSALDVSVQAQVLNLLNELKRELGLTMLFISHDLSVVRYMCDRIMVMHKGKIVESGDADEVYYQPKTEYTKMLISSIPKI